MMALLIDEDRERVATMMQVTGEHRTLTARALPSALKLAARYQPAVIIIADVVAGKSGIAAVPRLLAAVPTAAVIVASRYPTREAGEEALAAGAQIYWDSRFPKELVTLIGDAVTATRNAAYVAPTLRRWAH